ncbi:MAG TPA: DUF1080 domain-containing protein [Candidatus Hydrogenedentes bacterium]|nr:DUF1080 domain-containing protein [Candidatus Hydrogenedentota bacterium]
MKRMVVLAMVSGWVVVGCLANANAGQAADTVAGPAVPLFNGKDLDGWHMYLKDPDVDPKTVWDVRDGAIWCKGEPFGYLRTKQEYGNFKLVVEWRWPGEPANSGVLVRISGEDKVWPLSMEAQLKHEQAGDVVGMGCDFNENTRPAGEFFRVASRQNPSSEKKPGEWNTYEITCKGDTLELRVNGQLQDKATGMQVPAKGYIGLQSEGGPIMFRNIKLTLLP